MPPRNLNELYRLYASSVDSKASTAVRTMLMRGECQHLCRYLDTNGNGTGTKSAVGDYSVTPETFFIQPAAGTYYFLYRILFSVEDNGAPNAGFYGSNLTLTNGVILRSKTGAAEDTDFTDGIPIKRNAEFGRLAYDSTPQSYGIGDNFVLCRFTFDKFGGPLVLKGDDSQSLEIALNDDFSGLTGHYFMVEGQEATAANFEKYLV